MGQKGLYYYPIIYRTAHSLPNSECFRRFLWSELLYFYSQRPLLQQEGTNVTFYLIVLVFSEHFIGLDSRCSQ